MKLFRRKFIAIAALSLLAGVARADRIELRTDEGVLLRTFLPAPDAPATRPAPPPPVVPPPVVVTPPPETQPVPPVVVTPPPVTQPAGQTIFAGPTDDWGALAKGLRTGMTLALPRGAQWRGTLTLTVPCSVVSYGTATGRPVILAPVNSPSVFVAPGTTLASLTLRDLACRPADPNAARGEGVAIYGNVGKIVLDGVESSGFEQASVFVGGHGAVEIRNSWMHDTWATPDRPFRGQLIYLELPATAKPTIIDHCLLANAGTGNGTAANGFRHAIYSQHGGPGLLVSDTAISGAAAGGIQVRDGGSAARCFFRDCGVPVMATGKPFAVKDSLAVGGHRYSTGNGQSAGNVGVSAYSLVTLDNVRFLGTPGQAANGAANQFDMGLLMASQKYPDVTAQAWAAPGYPGRILFAGPVVARGWPGPTVSGDAAPKLNANVTVRTDQAPLTWLPNWRAKLGNGTATAGEALKAQGVN